MICDSVAYLARAGQARDLRRRALLRRLPRRPRATRSSACAPRPRPGRRTSRSATRTAPACPSRSPRPPGRGRRLGDRVAVGIHTHNDLECAGRELAGRGRGGREPGAGHDQRHTASDRQREPDLDPPRPAAQARLPLRCGRAARAAHRDRPLRRRAAQHHPGPGPALRRAQRLRPQGRHARAGVRPTRAPSSTWTRQRSATSARLLVSELSGKGTVLSRAERAGIDARRRQAAKRASSTLKEREHRGYHYEAADASFELLLRRRPSDYEPLFRLEGFRVMVEKREDGKVVDRGHDQDLGRRRALPAHRRGQRAR